MKSDGLQSSGDEDDNEEEEDDDEEESGNEQFGGDGMTIAKDFAKVGDLTDALYDLFTNVRTRPGSNQDHMRHVGQLVVLGQSNVARKRIENWVKKDVRPLFFFSFGICSIVAANLRIQPIFNVFTPFQILNLLIVSLSILTARRACSNN